MEVQVIQPPPLTNPEEPSVIRSMPKFPYIIVAVIVTVASAILVAWAFFKPLPSTESNLSISKQATQSAQAKKGGFPQVPVSISNPGVLSAQVAYIFKGTIQEIKTDPKGILVKTDIKGENVPKFVVIPTAKITIDTNGQKKTGTTADLATGQKVEIYITYGLKKKAWNDVSAITIFLGSPTPTPK